MCLWARYQWNLVGIFMNQRGWIIIILVTPLTFCPGPKFTLKLQSLRFLWNKTAFLIYDFAFIVSGGVRFSRGCLRMAFSQWIKKNNLAHNEFYLINISLITVRLHQTLPTCAALDLNLAISWSRSILNPVSTLYPWYRKLLAGSL